MYIVCTSHYDQLHMVIVLIMEIVVPPYSQHLNGSTNKVILWLNIRAYFSYGVGMIAMALGATLLITN